MYIPPPGKIAGSWQCLGSHPLGKILASWRCLGPRSCQNSCILAESVPLGDVWVLTPRAKSLPLDPCPRKNPASWWCLGPYPMGKIAASW